MISNQLKRHLGQKDFKEHNYIRMIKTETWISININKSNFVFSVVIKNTVNNNYMSVVDEWNMSMENWWHDNYRGHQAHWKHTRPIANLRNTYPTWTVLAQNPDLQRQWLVINYLTYGTAHPSTATGLTLIKSTTINSTTVTLIYHGYYWHLNLI